MSDTTPEMQAIQIEIYRKMAPEARLAAAFELSAMSRRLLEEGVRRRHPDYSDEQVRFAMLRLWLGDDDFQRAYPDAPTSCSMRDSSSCSNSCGDWNRTST